MTSEPPRRSSTTANGRRTKARRSSSRRRRTASSSARAFRRWQARSPRWRRRSVTPGAILGAIDLVTVEKGMKVREITVSCIDAAHGERVVDAVRKIDGVTVESVLDRTFQMHQGGKIQVNGECPGEDARRPLDGLHAGCCAHLYRHPPRRRASMVADRQGQHDRRGLRRDGGARPRRHRPRGGDAGDGGQGDAVQGIRGRGRVSAVPGHHRRRRDRRHRPGACAHVRRHQPRGHRRAALL